MTKDFLPPVQGKEKLNGLSMVSPETLFIVLIWFASVGFEAQTEG